MEKLLFHYFYIKLEWNHVWAVVFPNDQWVNSLEWEGVEGEEGTEIIVIITPKAFISIWVEVCHHLLTEFNVLEVNVVVSCS